MSRRRLAVIIPTWNDRDDVVACVESIREQVGPGDAVFVVDNASEDGTAAAVAAAFPWVRMLDSGANLGFAGAANLGLRQALDTGHRYVMLLNADTVVEAGALDALVDYLDRHPGAGAVQPLLVDARSDRIDSLGHVLRRVPGVRDLGRGDERSTAPTRAVEVFGACAAAVVLRAHTLHLSGLLDESLFVLFEDVDLMFRVRATGARVDLLPSVVVRHARGISRSAPGLRTARRFWLQRNIVALALRYWPLRWLVLAAPVLAARALHALSLSRFVRGHACLSLWRESWRVRRGARRSQRERGVDRWLTTPWLPIFNEGAAVASPAAEPGPVRAKPAEPSAFDRVEVDVGGDATRPGP